MSPNARRMPEINLEEFERRLRAAGSAQGGVEDPLEELTRLVNTIAADRPRDERVIDFSAVRPSRPAVGPPPPPPPLPSSDDDEPEFVPPPEVWEPTQRSLPATRDDDPPPEPPLLRPAFDEATQAPAEGDPARAAEPAAIAPAPVAAAPPVRKPSWYWKVGGLTAVGLAMVAGAVALKFGGVTVGTKTPPMILAASGPNKVAPPDEKTVQSASDTGALLNKDSTTAGPVKVVVNQEQPVDLNGADSPVAPMKDSPIIAPNQAPMVVASTPTTPSAPVATPAPPPAAPALPQKKPPKTVSVRPDGTLITADAAPTGAVAPSPAPPASAPVARKPDAAPTVTSQSASPTLDLPPPAKPPKSSARVNVAKTDTTAPTEPVSAPLQLGSAASGATDKLAKPPTKLRAPEPRAESQVADAAAQPAPSGGDWAVQLAAPRSDAEAQSAVQRLQTKFGSTLGETDLAVKKAEVNGETIYRVRASGLSKAEAASLCQKLKADGGDCFVTRN